METRGFARNNVDYAPIAALPKSADDAPLTISIRSTFSTAIRARSSFASNSADLRFAVKQNQDLIRIEALQLNTVAVGIATNNDAHPML